MFQTLMRKVFGTKHDREMKRLQPLVNKINSLEPDIEKLNDADLAGKTVEFKNRLEQGATLDDLLPEAFAVCREASRRVLGMRHYDVQLIGGMVLHSGQIAEMRTGEGKTLVATLPVYLNALSGKGVHVVTVNDYLATRDAEWMGQVYTFLGLTVRTIVHDLSDEQRKEAYNADITYATNNELGFDYLRDNMKFDLEEYVQRELNYAIIDECDSILVDEARTPLIISGPAEDSTEKYYQVNEMIPHLREDVDFTMEEKTKTASLTEEGNHAVEKLLGLENLYDPQHISLLHHVYQGLKAHHLFRLDIDYMVKDGEVMIVDEFTGRLMPGRRWSDGLHQAIEAKEGVRVKSENQTLASITFQNYFRMYNKLSGMTGTADTEAVEFKKIYKLDVNVIPTNKPIARKDLDDVVYKTQHAKFNAIAADIKERREKGQPVLVGTVSIEKSEIVGNHLRKLGVPHNVLNAKHHEREADIVAQAGRKGAVTIATNMAGRGTDIVLGGNPENLAKAEADPEKNPEKYESALEKFTSRCEAEKEEVIGAGGLYIIGTERHDSRRIDNQLRGRAGRQGDPGESRFYLALDDNLMRIFGGERISKIMDKLNVPEDEPITAPMVSRSIEGSQRKVEGHNFDIRKNILEYDDVMNQQRHVIYGLRRDILENKKNAELIQDMLGDVTSHILDTFANEEIKKEKWDLSGLNTALGHQFGLQIEFPEISQLDAEKVTDAVSSAVKEVFEKQKEHLGELYPQVEKMILLQVIDQRWKEHLQRIDHLKEGIGLRGFAQKDPLVEYKKEAFNMFEGLNATINSDVVEKLLKVQIVTPEQQQYFQDAPHYDDSGFEYDAPEADSLGVPGQLSGPGGPGQGPGQNMSFSHGPEEPPKMNRAQRREEARQKKRKKR